MNISNLNSSQIQRMLMALPDLSFVLDNEGCIIGYFTRDEEALFVPPAVFMNKQFREFLPPDIIDDIQTAFDRAIRTGEISTTHYTLPIGPKREFFEGRFAPFKDKTGAMYVVRNVTKQIETEEKLLSLSKLHQLIVEFSSLLIQSNIEEIDRSIDQTLKMLGEYADVDRVYIFEYNSAEDVVNNTYEWCATGISPEIENLQGIPFDAVPRWKEKFALKEHVYIPLIAEIDPQYHVEKEILEPQGIQSLLALPMFYGEKLIGFIGFDAVRHTREWSDEHISLLRLAGEIIAGTVYRQKFEREIIQARKEAEQASIAKSEFLANMSHEIRTPMNAILGFSEILFNNTHDTKSKNYLSGILSSGKTLLYLINDILDLSKIEAGQMEIITEPACVKEIFCELEKMFLTKLEEKQLGFKMTIADNLPDILLIDDVRLRQVLFNLMGNAIKFTHSGHIELSASARPTMDNPDMVDVEISVKDTGIGIPDTFQKKIFEAFVQVETDNTKQYGGTGLGLAITNRLVEMMNGTIRVQSKVNEGSAFTVTLYKVQPTDNLPERKNVFEWIDKIVDFEPAKILVVDDVDFNRELVSSYLTVFDLTVLEAKSAKEGITIANVHKPDLILMDLRMPNMNGYEATRKLRKQSLTKNIPCIAFTASSMKHDEEAIRELFDDYLLKPLTRNELIDCLLHFLPHQLHDPDHAPETIQIQSEEDILKALTEDNEKLPALKDYVNSVIFPNLNKLLIYLDPDVLEEMLSQINELNEKFQTTLFANSITRLQEASESYDFEAFNKELIHIEKLLQQITER
jgi:signal transduction histidine kinase/DNA-binding NarL/FixJ family response regulator